MAHGKLIVIDGTDGSGKATQTELLLKHLRKDGRRVQVMDFPQYSNFFGGFIGHCLHEQYYNFVKVHPKIASVLYAADRFESSEKIKNWIKAGNIVIANRYASANQIHQGGKISNTKKREEFLKWLAEMEYEVLKISRPDVVFYLDVPIKITTQLVKHRGNKKDAHEKDTKFLENSRKSALWLAKTQKNWIKIDCVKNGAMDTRKSIHNKVYSHVTKLLKR